MDYKVVRTCHGFRGRKWVEGTIVTDIRPDETPPRHFVPLNQVPPVPQAPVEPHRTEAKEMPAGQDRQVPGGFAQGGTGIQKIDRQMTTDQVPHQGVNEPAPRNSLEAGHDANTGADAPDQPAEQPAEAPQAPETVVETPKTETAPEGGEGGQAPSDEAPLEPTDEERQAEADA